jgi:peptidoglycan/LPS O-acetylase OafA/YrhL
MRSFPVQGAEFRQNNFDFIRCVLALAVVLSHCWPLTHGSDGTEPLYRLTNARLTLGGAAVNFFFAISGYLVANSWAAAPSIRPFLKKRAARIYPGYTVVVFLCVAVMWLAWDRQGPFPIGRRVAGAVWESITLGIPSSPHTFVSNPLRFMVNGSLWTVRFEFWCYIFLALAGAAGLMSRRGAVLAALVVAFAAACYLDITGTSASWGAGWVRVLGELAAWPRFATYMLVGIAFYQWRGHIPYSGVLASIAALISGLSLIRPYGLSVVMPACGMYLLFFVAYAPLGLYGFGRYGDFSYGIYLYAFPIQQLLVMRFGTGLSELELFFLSAPAAVVAGALSWHLVEKRFIRRRRHATAANAPSTAPAWIAAGGSRLFGSARPAWLAWGRAANHA